MESVVQIRRCLECGYRLSAYNPDEFCNACEPCYATMHQSLRAHANNGSHRAAMSAKYRRVMDMREKELSRGEVAERLGIAESTVARYLRPSDGKLIAGPEGGVLVSSVVEWEQWSKTFGGRGRRKFTRLAPGVLERLPGASLVGTGVKTPAGQMSEVAARERAAEASGVEMGKMHAGSKRAVAEESLQEARNAVRSGNGVAPSIAEHDTDDCSDVELPGVSFGESEGELARIDRGIVESSKGERFVKLMETLGKNTPGTPPATPTLDGGIDASGIVGRVPFEEFHADALRQAEIVEMARVEREFGRLEGLLLTWEGKVADKCLDQLAQLRKTLESSGVLTSVDA